MSPGPQLHLSDPEFRSQQSELLPAHLERVKQACDAAERLARDADDDASVLNDLRWYEKFRQRWKQLTPGTKVWLYKDMARSSPSSKRWVAEVVEQGHTAKTYVVRYIDDKGAPQLADVTDKFLEYRDAATRLLPTTQDA